MQSIFLANLLGRREEPVPGERYTKRIPVSFGFCIQLGRQRGPLCRICRSYTEKETSRP